MMKNFTEIITERCVLTHITCDEIKALRDIFNDPVTREFLPEIYPLVDSHNGISQFIKTFEHYFNCEDGILLGVRFNGDIIGFVAIIDMQQMPSLFYAMHPNYRQCGYMFEALDGVMCYLRNGGYCSRISTEIYKNNTTSLKLLGKLSFQLGHENLEKYWLHRDI